MLNLCGGLLSGFAPLVGGLWKRTIGMEGLLTGTAIAYVVGALALLAGTKFLFPRDYARVH